MINQLWTAYAADRDVDLRNRLVVHYGPLVKFVATRLASRLPATVDTQDLVSEGMVGLIDAIERFQPERGVAFTTFAVPRIHGAIMDSLRAMDWIPRRVRTDIKRLEEARAEWQEEMGATPSDAELATVLGLSTARVAELDRTREEAQVASLDELLIADTLAGASPAESSFETSDSLRHGLESLRERDQVVLALYYIERLTLGQIGEVLGVTESRVSQLKTRATLALRQQLGEVLRARSAV